MIGKIRKCFLLILYFSYMWQENEFAVIKARGVVHESFIIFYFFLFSFQKVYSDKSNIYIYIFLFRILLLLLFLFYYISEKKICDIFKGAFYWYHFCSFQLLQDKLCFIINKLFFTSIYIYFIFLFFEKQIFKQQ